MPLFQLLLVPFLIITLDQGTKFLAQNLLASVGSVSVLDGIFQLTLVHNKGAAFGFLKGGTFIFIAVTIVCVIVIFLALKRNTIFLKFLGLDASNRLTRFSLGLILGGACGNLLDRLRFSYVIDFLDFRVWPVFNVADSAITIGGILIFYMLLKSSKIEKVTKSP